MEPGVGTNRFVYSANDPVNLRDPSGNATYLADGSQPDERGEYTVTEDGDVVLIDKGGNEITLRGYVRDPDAFAGYDSEQRMETSLYVDWRAGMDHRRDMSFDHRPPNYDQAIEFSKGFASTVRGLARCVMHCGRGASAVSEIISDPEINGDVAVAIAKYGAENPAFTAGRMAPGAVAAAGAFVVTKSPNSAALSPGVQFLAASGDVGYHISRAQQRNIVLSNRQIKMIVASGLDRLD